MWHITAAYLESYVSAAENLHDAVTKIAAFQWIMSFRMRLCIFEELTATLEQAF